MRTTSRFAPRRPLVRSSPDQLVSVDELFAAASVQARAQLAWLGARPVPRWRPLASKRPSKPAIERGVHASRLGSALKQACLHAIDRWDLPCASTTAIEDARSVTVVAWNEVVGAIASALGWSPGSLDRVAAWVDAAMTEPAWQAPPPDREQLAACAALLDALVAWYDARVASASGG